VEDAALDALEAELLGDGAAAGGLPTFHLTSASQGEAALAEVLRARAAGAPFAVAFVDMRMPPGWNGLQTIQQIWAVDPAIEVVICTAYSDLSTASSANWPARWHSSRPCCCWTSRLPASMKAK
jgi:CheY-like chemotaxis protein